MKIRLKTDHNTQLISDKLELCKPTSFLGWFKLPISHPVNGVEYTYFSITDWEEFE